MGLRSFGEGKKPVETFFQKGWRAPSAQELFKNIETYIEPIPEDERWNLYWTVGDCIEAPGRKVKRQEVVPFDIDYIKHGEEEKVLTAACEALGLDPAKTGAVFSGNGIQFFVQGHDVMEPETDPEIYEKMRPAYKAACGKINLWLKENGLEGKADPSVWSPARIMRLPMTLNKKPGKEIRTARLLNRNIEPQDWDLRAATGIVEMAPRDQVDMSLIRRVHGKMDLEVIDKECGFIHKGSTDAASMTEPEWFTWLGVLAFADPEDHKWIHEKSKSHPGYSENETNQKILQVLDNQRGPRSCHSIHTKEGFEGCKLCPHWGKITTPAQLRGADHIATETTGFHRVTITPEGRIKVGKPEFTDLAKFWRRQHDHVAVSGNLFIFERTHWRLVDKYELEAFAQKQFKPTPDSKYFAEFCKVLIRENNVHPDFFDKRPEGFVNFSNGVLELATGELREHSAEYRFKYVLPYPWNPKAVSPIWDRFVKDVTQGDEEVQLLLNEYLGYALEGSTPDLQKALFLHGGGANGKSTYLNVIRQVLGGVNCAGVGPGELSDQNKVRTLDGKLASITEEVDRYNLQKTSVIKNAITGGELWAKTLYADTYQFTTRAKFYFAGNEKPLSQDKEEGLYRRLIFVPFNAYFGPEQADPHLEKKLKDPQVLSYIARKAIESIQTRKERGRFKIPEVSLAEMEEYKDTNDQERVFVNERLHFTKNPADFVPTMKIYEVYKEWCDETENKPLPSQRFKIALTKHLRGKAEYHRTHSLRGYTGIKFIGSKVWPL